MNQCFSPCETSAYPLEVGGLGVSRITEMLTPLCASSFVESADITRNSPYC